MAFHWHDMYFVRRIRVAVLSVLTCFFNYTNQALSHTCKLRVSSVRYCRSHVSFLKSFDVNPCFRTTLDFQQTKSPLRDLSASCCKLTSSCDGFATTYMLQIVTHNIVARISGHCDCHQAPLCRYIIKAVLRRWHACLPILFWIVYT